MLKTKSYGKIYSTKSCKYNEWYDTECSDKRNAFNMARRRYRDNKSEENLKLMKLTDKDYKTIRTTNLAAVVCVCVWMCVCQCAKFDQFLPERSYFESKRPEHFVRIAKFPYAAFGPLFAFHCPLFFTRNNDLECKSSRFAAVVRRSVADRQLHLNGVIRSAGVAQWQELGPKT